MSLKGFFSLSVTKDSRAGIVGGFGGEREGSGLECIQGLGRGSEGSNKECLRRPFIGVGTKIDLGLLIFLRSFLVNITGIRNMRMRRRRRMSWCDIKRKSKEFSIRKRKSLRFSEL